MIYSMISINIKYIIYIGWLILIIFIYKYACLYADLLCNNYLNISSSCFTNSELPLHIYVIYLYHYWAYVHICYYIYIVLIFDVILI